MVGFCFCSSMLLQDRDYIIVCLHFSAIIGLVLNFYNAFVLCRGDYIDLCSSFLLWYLVFLIGW